MIRHKFDDWQILPKTKSYFVFKNKWTEQFIKTVQQNMDVKIKILLIKKKIPIKNEWISIKEYKMCMINEKLNLK